MIFGRVLDPQSSAIPGATVQVTNLDTNTTASLITNATGYYAANLLLPGQYQVTAEAAGLKKSVRRGIQLTVSAHVQVDLRLEIGSVNESVSVTADAPLLETNSVSSGRVIDSLNVTSLPSQNKNAILLVRLTPGIQSNGINAVSSVYNTNALSQYGYMPGNVGGNEWSMDGMPNNDMARRVIEQPFTDVVEEFKVETSGFDASVGHTLGAVVEAKTRSGTNALHGSISELHWQQRWQATPFFTRQLYYRQIDQALAQGNQALANSLRSQSPQPSGHSNNYAGTIGGPVVIPKLVNGRNKLFFFFSYNGLRDEKAPPASSINRTVPTLAERKGDFSDLLAVNASLYQIYDPLSVRSDPARAGHYIRDPIPGNILPQARIVNPGYNVYTKLLPSPNNNPLSANLQPTNNYLAVGIPTESFYKDFTNRLDYQPSEKNRLFGRWGWRRPYEPGGDWTYQSAPGLMDSQYIRLNRNATLDWVYLPSSRTVLDFAASANESSRRYGFTVPFQYKPSDVGMPAYLDAKAGKLAVLPVMSFAGYDTLGQNPQPLIYGRTLSAKAQISHIRGKHSLQAGFDARQNFETGGGAGNTAGNFTFGNTYTRRNDDTLTPPGTLGLSWAAFMVGLPDSSTIATNDTYAEHSPYYGWYIQDNWRLTPRFTLNLGLRAEFEQGPTERYNRLIGGFDVNATLPISAAAQAAYARNPVPELAAANFVVKGGSIYPGSGGITRQAIQSELMWLPRIAGAYQIGSRTVLRAGYGMFFDPIDVLNWAGPDQTGFSRTTSTNLTNNFGVTWLAGNPTQGVSPLTDPFPVRADGTRFDVPVRDALGLMARAGSGWRFNDYNQKHTRQHRWRIGVQRQLSGSMVFSAAYAGTYADRIPIVQTLSALPAQFWAMGTTRNDAIASNLNSQVANPFQLSNFAGLQSSDPKLYQYMSTLGFFTSPTIAKNLLLRPFPQMNGLTEGTSSLGKSRSHAMELNLERRFARGLNLNLSYTMLRQRDADILTNEFDGSPAWRLSNSGRPHRLVGSAVYELPFGKGRALARRGVPNYLFGGFQVSVTYEYQPGPLLDWGNLFYYGNPGDINNAPHTLAQWFNTADFQTTASKAPAAYQARVFPTRVDGVRADMTNEWDASITRDFRIREHVRLQLRFDALNLQNRSQFSAPVTDPISTQFGQVTSQTAATKRFIQIQGRLSF